MKLQNGWLRPSRCASNGCVEVSKGEDGMIRLRSSLSPYGVARMTEEEFRLFIQSAKDGDYDHLYEDEEPKKVTWEDAEALARAQVVDIEQKREQQILREGYTGDL